MGLYKRDDSPYWWYRFQFKGSKVRESAGTTDREEAEQVEAQRKRELFEQHRLGVKPRHLWQSAVVEYLDQMPEGITKYNTRRTLRWLEPYLLNVPVSEIDRGKLVQIREAKIKAINSKKAAAAARGVPSRWKTAQPSTVNRVLGIVVTILNYAVDELEWLDRAPKSPTMKVTKKDPVSATQEKALKLIAALPKHQIPMVIFDLEVGWRRHNVTHLEWPQVDLDRAFSWVTAEDAKARNGIPAPLSDTALEVLRGQVGKHPRWVFPYRGKPVVQTSTRAYRRARDAAGLPPSFTWHALRHTWASWHSQGGTPRHVLKELGGWKSDKMVAHYAHLGGEHLRPFVKSHLEVGTKVGTAKKQKGAEGDVSG